MILAIQGGRPVRTKLFPNQSTITDKEKASALSVLQSKITTGYQGNGSDARLGGKMVRRLESLLCETLGSKYAILVNSATSGLWVACMAVGKPGTQCVVSPWSMSCSASIPALCGMNPIFSDIDEYFTVDPFYIEGMINSRVSTILSVDLFGGPCDHAALGLIAQKNGLKTIQDSAQAIYSKHVMEFTGIQSDMGILSFNSGKHLDSGEGGAILTNDSELAEKCRFLMNHGEAQNNELRIDHLNNIIGMNLRMSELQAALVLPQLTRLKEMVSARVSNVEYLHKNLRDIPFIRPGAVRKGCTHTYYVSPWHYFQENAPHQIHRDKYIEAVRAELQPCEGREHEGVPIRAGYTAPLYTLPVFQPNVIQLPNVERYQNEEVFIIHRLIGPMADTESLDDVIRAFHKVAENMEELSQ